MALVVGDVLQITDFQTYLSQQVLNVYFYRLLSQESEVTYDDVLTAFRSVVLSAVTTVQGTGLIHVTSEVKNLTNGLDIFSRPEALAGALSGEEQPSFLALGFRLNRTTALTRHGSKRIGGIPEGVTTSNGIVSTFLDEVAAVAVALAADITRSGTVDHDLVAEPVIVGRILTGEPNAGELDLTKINPVVSAQFVRVTTQTTRRAGRGS